MILQADDIIPYNNTFAITHKWNYMDSIIHDITYNYVVTEHIHNNVLYLVMTHIFLKIYDSIHITPRINYVYV